ncbi:hypothetical protein SAMN05443287_104402 [Micromonospora phaseoli]|uniref:DUF2726 domain-containing protein n=1 Tax=Micromonospora phaseoli TaxID=1144548 RepID=A0A1H6Z3E1_9ACTN|nr:hypothetical protein [Micromonospora phaseoli]PZW00373.1 hypothetical protein CLV64_103401 [Micromonospora phaseoli]GIJ76851.1 hypothetical protein Xph01_12830 [Micromonospora phaseoli]SEJ44082.1 hypothetical protein SAMN05443287_104402 [Micromonospora phaseoli]
MTGDDSWLSTVPTGAGRGPALLSTQRRVHAGLRLGELLRRRPPGLTGNQWSTASRTLLDQVVCAADTGRPEFAVELRPPSPDSAARRAERTTEAVVTAIGLPLLRIASATLRAAEHGPRIAGYVIDARRYAEGADASAQSYVEFRDIVGRLPDGRDGAVNDLGVLARVEAVEAYVARRLTDPILRGLHVYWAQGPAEGWSWAEVRPGGFLVERVTLCAYGLHCGIDLARFAEDLAVLAVGERLRKLETETPTLVSREELLRAIRGLRARQDDLVDTFAYDHLCQD